MKLNEIILKLRKKNGLSQEKLSEKMGVTRQTISNWELGDTIPTAEQIILLSKIFKTTADEILGLDSKDIILEKVSGTENLIKKQIKFTKIIFVTIYIVILSILICFIIHCFTLKDFTKDYQDVIYCEINEKSFRIMITPGEYNRFDEKSDSFIVIDDSIWRMHVEEYDKNGKITMNDIGFSAGYSYKEAMDSLYIVKEKIIKQGGTCR